MKRLIAGILLLGTVVFSKAVAQDSSVYVKEVFTSGNQSMPYRILLPRGYDSTKQYPLVLFLHGETERGKDNEKQLETGSSIFLNGAIRRRYPAIVVFPQCPKDDNWSNAVLKKDRKTKKQVYEFQPDGEPTKAMVMLMALQNKLLQDYLVDSSKIYVMGYSMGGNGTYELLRRMPGMFAAAVPMGGGADSSTAKAIRKTAFWIFHGKNDDVIPLKNTEEMVGALQGFYTTGPMQLTVYSNTGHSCWDQALAEPELLRWLFAQRLER